jgi:hypothetical protein
MGGTQTATSLPAWPKSEEPVDDLLDALVWMAGSQKRQAGDYLVDALLSMRRTTKKKAKRKGAIVPPN